MAMKWYDLSARLDDDEDVYFANESNLFHMDYFDLKLGKRIEVWNADSFFRSKSSKYDGELTDILGEHLGLPTFSSRLREALEKADIATTDIQYLPVRVFKSTGEEAKGFSIANVISRIAALNYENSVMLEQDESEIDRLTGKQKVTSVWTPALREEPLMDHDAIRLLEFFPPVFVSERFAEVFREGGFTGGVLNPVTICQ
jgi:hypothetical protein